MPLTFDFPKEQLLTYNGTNPKPKDFDLFWEQGLQELETVSPQVELVPASFQANFADCFDLYFTGIGGARIHSKLMRPRHVSSNQPALLMFHGYAYHSGSWMEKIGYTAAGFTVAAMDCRGQGGESQDLGGVTGNTQHGHIIRGLKDAIHGSPEKLLYRNIFLDTVQLARVVMDLPGVDPSRVGATGASQGGALTVACASLEPRIAKAAPVYPFLSDYKRIWEIDLAREAYGELSEYFRLYDPTHELEQAFFENLGYIDIQYLADRIKAEVLWTTAYMDTICPPSTQYAAYNKITSKKRMVEYPDFGHEELPGSADRIFQFFMDL